MWQSKHSVVGRIHALYMHVVYASHVNTCEAPTGQLGWAGLGRLVWPGAGSSGACNSSLSTDLLSPTSPEIPVKQATPSDRRKTGRIAGEQTVLGTTAMLHLLSRQPGEYLKLNPDPCSHSSMALVHG